MKQQFTRKLMLLAVMLLAGVGSSFAFEVNGLKYEIIDANDRTVKVTYAGNTEYDTSTSYNETSYTIPSVVSYSGYDFTVVEIGNYAFHLTNAQTIILPSTIQKIGNYAFWAAHQLKSINIPSSVTEFGNNVFYLCSNLTSVDFQGKMNSIPVGFFEGCTSLTSFEIPESANFVNGDAFKGCTNLTKITILNQDDTYIASGAFEGCNNLQTIVSFSRSPYCDNESFIGDAKFNAKVYVPESMVDTYKNANGWSGFLNILPMDNTVVGGHVVDVPGGYLYNDQDTKGTITVNGKPANPEIGRAFVIDPNTDVVIGFVPNSDAAWSLETATVNGTDVTTALVDGKYTIKNINGNQLVKATWKQGKTYTLNIGGFNNGHISVNGTDIYGSTTYTYAEGKNITLVIQPNDGYGISSFQLNYTDEKNNLTNNGDGTYSYTFTLTADTEVYIYFDKKWSLTTTFNAGGSVTIGGESVTSGTVKEIVGAMSEVVVKANQGYEITSVLYNGTEYLANMNTWSSGEKVFWPSSDQGDNQTLAVTFTIVNPTISASYDTAKGSVSIAGSQLMPGTTQSVAIGSNVTFTVTPFLGYQINRVMLYGATASSDITSKVKAGGNSYTISNIDQNFNIEVMFGTIPAPADVTATIETLGMATLYSPYALDFSGVTGLKAYIVSAFTPANNHVILTQVTDVPAKTGIVLVGSAGNYTIPTTTTKTYVANLLKGADYDVVMNSSDGTFTNYILANGSNGLGFYVIEDGTTLAAGKAYLAIPNASLSSAPQFVSMDIEGSPTGIKTIDADMTDKAVYNLSGQRQSGLKKGINIVGGKKIVVK